MRALPVGFTLPTLNVVHTISYFCTQLRMKVGAAAFVLTNMIEIYIEEEVILWRKISQGGIWSEPRLAY